MDVTNYVELGDLTAKKAWDDDLEDQIAEITQLPRIAVEERLLAAHGRTLLRTLFAKEWPNEAAALGALTVARVEEWGLDARLARLMKKGLRWVQWKMFRAHENMRIVDLFGDAWPALREPVLGEEELERLRLEDLPARFALDSQTIARIAKLTRLRLQTVKDRLRAAHGQKFLRNVFAAEWDGTRVLDPAPRRRGAAAAMASPTNPAPRQGPDLPQALFSWLHISDLHFGHGDAEQGWDQKLVLRELRGSVVELLQTSGVPKPDVILATGDIAFSGATRRQDEYEQAQEYLCALAETLELTRRDIFLVPGNHDVQRSLDHNPMAAALVQATRNGSSLPFDMLLDNPDTRAQLASRQTNYLKFASAFGPRSTEPQGRPFHWRHRLKRRGLDVVLLGLNTALLAADEQDRGYLRIGKRAMNDLLEGLPQEALVIALSHHPIERRWLADEEEVRGWLARYAHVHLSGHLHEAHSEDSHIGGAAGRLVRVRAGAAHGDKPVAGGSFSHGYNLAAVIRQPEGGLALRIWPRRWSATKKDFRVDAEHTERHKIYAEHPLHLYRSFEGVSLVAD